VNKKNQRFPDFFLDFEKIEEMIDDMMGKMEESTNFDPTKPIVMGLSIRIDPSGNSQIVEMKPSDATRSNDFVAQPEPLVEIQNADGGFLVTVEMPGVKKENLALQCDANELIVQSKNTNPNYYKKIRFQEELNPKQINAEFRNGILEIQIPKKEVSGEKTPIQIR